MFICIVLFYIFKLFFVRSQNLPVDDDLEIYIDALKGVSEFYKKHLSVININSLFALFVTNVNLRHIFANHEEVSSSIKNDMNFIFQTNKRSIRIFSKTSNSTLPRQHRTIPTLFANITMWVKHLYQFTYTERIQHSEYKLKNIYSDWKTYKKNVLNLEDGTPSPELSNTCLSSLAEFPTNTKKGILSCALKDTCNNALENGSGYGYALSHRILWLLMARYARGCSIWVSRGDKELSARFCAMGFDEIRYNVFNKYDLGDLAFELICTCALSGHSEFLNRDWLNAILELQITSGCFKKPGKDHKYDASPGATNICDHHITSVSTCSLAVANLPLDEDIEIYIDAIKAVSNFYNQHIDKININCLFGLFVINVNMKHIMDNKNNVSSSIKSVMKSIFETNLISIETFSKTANSTLPWRHRTITTLFADITIWVKNLYPFTYTERSLKSEYNLRYIYPVWETYKKNVQDLEKGTPAPNLSNICLSSLAEYPINTKDRILGCHLKDTCMEALVNGTDYGYSLSHRILWLLMARYARGCNILLSRSDKELTETFCAMGFSEITYNAIKNFSLGDLAFEFICTCALSGHAEFLQKDWLNATLVLQTGPGCFKKPGTENVTDDGPDESVLCDHHSSSVSACSLAVTVRYIVEKYKFYPF